MTTGDLTTGDLTAGDLTTDDLTAGNLTADAIAALPYRENVGVMLLNAAGSGFCWPAFGQPHTGVANATGRH